MTETIATGTIAAGRVKLKNHVYFGVVADGVLFDAGDASFVLKERSVYPAVEKLIALIDAGHAAANIIGHAPAKLAGFFQKVLSLLAEHGMLLAVDEDAPPARQLVAHTPSNELRKFLEDRLAGRSVDAALRRWHEARVVVAGAGQALLSAVRALADSGCTHLTVVRDGGPADGLDDLRDELESVCAVRFFIRDTLADDCLADPAGLLVYASDDAVLAPLLRIERAMREKGMAGAIGAVFGDRACVLPASLPGRPGVADLLHWLPQPDAAAASLGPMAMALLGCVAAHAALCRFFGIEEAASSGQAAFVSARLEVESSMLVVSAQGRGASLPFVHPPKYQTPEWRALLPFEQIRYALDPWFDAVLGPFSVVADDDIEQVPLLQYPLRVRSASDTGTDTVVVGWGLEHGAAVVRGLSRAIEALARTFRQDGPALVCEFDDERWKRRALAHAVAGSDEMAKRHRWAWVDLEQLPPGPARVLHALLRFHAPDGVAVQMQWSGGDAFIVRVSHAGAPLCCAVAADPVDALEEGLGQACSMFQLQKLDGAPFRTGLALPAPDDAAQVADWRDALRAAQAGGAHEAEFHLLAAPGFPPAVYCGYASLKPGAGAA
jgi:hypothetical protein